MTTPSGGIGALIAGVVLDLIGFAHGLPAVGALQHAIPGTTVRNLGLVYGPGASVLTWVFVATLLRYRRGREDHHQVRATLSGAGTSDGSTLRLVARRNATVPPSQPN
jgi:hypothetical protein